jgi:hypothetical protein
VSTWKASAVVMGLLPAKAVVARTTSWVEMESCIVDYVDGG